MQKTYVNLPVLEIRESSRPPPDTSVSTFYRLRTAFETSTSLPRQAVVAGLREFSCYGANRNTITFKLSRCRGSTHLQWHLEYSGVYSLSSNNDLSSLQVHTPSGEPPNIQASILGSGICFQHLRGSFAPSGGAISPWSSAGHTGFRV